MRLLGHRPGRRRAFESILGNDKPSDLPDRLLTDAGLEPRVRDQSNHDDPRTGRQRLLYANSGKSEPIFDRFALDLGPLLRCKRS